MPQLFSVQLNKFQSSNLFFFSSQSITQHFQSRAKWNCIKMLVPENGHVCFYACTNNILNQHLHFNIFSFFVASADLNQNPTFKKQTLSEQPKLDMIKQNGSHILFHMKIQNWSKPKIILHHRQTPIHKTATWSFTTYYQFPKTSACYEYSMLVGLSFCLYSLQSISLPHSRLVSVSSLPPSSFHTASPKSKISLLLTSGCYYKPCTRANHKLFTTKSTRSYRCIKWVIHETLALTTLYSLACISYWISSSHFKVWAGLRGTYFFYSPSQHTSLFRKCHGCSGLITRLGAMLNWG